MTRRFPAGLFAIMVLGLVGAGQEAAGVEVPAAQANGDGKVKAGASVRHECKKFDPLNLQVAGAEPKYWLTDNGEWIMSIHGSHAEARLALYIIRFYGMDEFCVVGGAPRAMSYFLVKGQAPRGHSPSEDCMWFDKDNLQLRNMAGQWTLADRNNLKMSLGSDEAAAREAFGVIRSRKFSEICFVGRPSASMLYYIQ